MGLEFMHIATAKLNIELSLAPCLFAKTFLSITLLHRPTWPLMRRNSKVQETCDLTIPGTAHRFLVGSRDDLGTYRAAVGPRAAGN